MSASDLKTIVYRGGVVRFRIPADWQEEYGPAGGGTFYAPGDDTGTLRLNVTTFGAPPGRILSAHDAEGFLAPFAGKYGVPVQTLRPGVAMIRYDIPAAEVCSEIVPGPSQSTNMKAVAVAPPVRTVM